MGKMSTNLDKDAYVALPFEGNRFYFAKTKMGGHLYRNWEGLGLS